MDLPNSPIVFPGGKKIGDFFPGVSSDSFGIGGDSYVFFSDLEKNMLPFFPIPKESEERPSPQIPKESEGTRNRKKDPGERSPPISLKSEKTLVCRPKSQGHPIEDRVPRGRFWTADGEKKNLRFFFSRKKYLRYFFLREIRDFFFL